jgi:hypothetical protein
MVGMSREASQKPQQWGLSVLARPRVHGRVHLAAAPSHVGALDELSELLDHRPHDWMMVEGTPTRQTRERRLVVRVVLLSDAPSPSRLSFGRCGSAVTGRPRITKSEPAASAQWKSEPRGECPFDAPRPADRLLDALRKASYLKGLLGIDRCSLAGDDVGAQGARRGFRAAHAATLLKPSTPSHLRT